MKDNWYEIVETLQPCIANNTIESEYQKKIEGCLKILGWKSSNKTMQSQIDIRIGNNNSIRPDIVLYKNNIQNHKLLNSLYFYNNYYTSNFYL